MNLILQFAIISLISTNLFAQNSYKLYDRKGKVIEFESVVEMASQYDVVLFGELHNSKSVHVIQLEFSEALNKKSKLLLGAEMFETDQQNELNEYLQGITSADQFEKETRLWSNYQSDYKPLVDFAKNNNLSFYATNSPRILARLVSRHGKDSLLNSANDSIKELLAPLPYEVNMKSKSYKEMLEMDMGHGHGMDPLKLVEAQALKDATMAYFIAENVSEGTLFVHFNGDFHSKNHLGIGEYLEQYNKSLKVFTISSVVATETDLNFDKKWKKRGDVIIVVSEGQ